MYGVDSLLPFVDDLKKLHLNGINIVNSQHYTFCGALIALLADNLATHSVGGFKECFSWAKRMCCSCVANMQSTQIS